MAYERIGRRKRFRRYKPNKDRAPERRASGSRRDSFRMQTYPIGVPGKQ